MAHILILGGGAAGLAAALAAAQTDPTARVTVLERSPRPGKKLLATGNGRCNLDNEGITPESYSSADRAALDALLREREIGLVVLAGFMTVLPDSFCRHFENRIINVHPSLIPSFCGEGFYGLRVHEAALAKGVKVTGATVHFVSEVVDGGAIIAQKAVEVEDGDTPETLQKRVMQNAEWILLPQAVSDFCAGRLRVDGAIVHKN